MSTKSKRSLAADDEEKLTMSTAAAVEAVAVAVAVAVAETSNPNKRPRLDNSSSEPRSRVTALSERDVGIEEYVDAAARPAFHAIIKQRFTDFQVYEVDQSGHIQHVTDLGPPRQDPPSALQQRIDRELNPQAQHAQQQQQPTQPTAKEDKVNTEPKQPAVRPAWTELSDELIQTLPSYFAEDSIAQLKNLWDTGFRPEPTASTPAQEGETQSQSKGTNKKPADPRIVTSKPLSAKQDRTAAHGLIRTLFHGYLVSEASNKYTGRGGGADAPKTTNGADPEQPSITVKWTANGRPDAAAAQQQRDRNSHQRAAQDEHPPYLHFLLQKTNRDSHDALALLSRSIGLPSGCGGGGGRGRGGGRGGGPGAGGGHSHDLAVAGTKDRRSVSVQRVSLLRRGKSAEQVWALANGCELDFESDLGSSDTSREGGGRGGRGGRGGGRGRGRGRGGGPGGRFDGDSRTFKEAMTTRGAKGLRIAHLQYANSAFRLGDLKGNEFVITLRNIKILDPQQLGEVPQAEEEDAKPDFAKEEEVIAHAMGVLKERGFINYYGMQRFGTSEISTHELGIPLFLADYKRAVNLLLAPRRSSSFTSTSTSTTPVLGTIEADVARARQHYGQLDLQSSLDAMPKSYVAERTVLTRLIREEERNGWTKIPRDEEGLAERALLKRDWLSAFSAIPKTLRMMYVHAYQSYIWNRLVSERVRRYGLDAPVVGDYVFLNRERAEEDGDAEEGGAEGETAANEDGPVAQRDEDEIMNGAGSSKNSGSPAEAALLSAADTAGTKPKANNKASKVKVLTEADLQSYSIRDVLMPSPGSEVGFEPGSWADVAYRDLLAKDGLKPEDLGSSSQPEYALRGTYRKIVHVPRDLSYQTLRYTDPHIDLALSDEDRLLGFTLPPSTQASAETNEGKFLALQIRLVLGTSAYATMALREVLKAETSSAAQRELTMKSEDQAFAGRGMNGDGHAGGGVGAVKVGE